MIPPSQLAYLPLACLCLICVCLTARAAAPKIQFSCWIPPETSLYSELETAYQKAFAQLGYEFSMQFRPGQRSLFEAEKGITDGECAREANYLREVPDSQLLKVDILVGHSDLVVWSHIKDLSINSIEELLKTNYRMGYAVGDKTTEGLIKRHKINAYPIANHENALKMLSAGRIDLYIHPSAIIKLQLARMQLERPVYPAGVLLHMYAYPYLHKKHQDLAVPLVKALENIIPAGGIPLP